MDEAQLIDNPAQRRFELPLEDGSLAFIDYLERKAGVAGAGAVFVLTHAEVPSQWRGRGVGARLTRATLALLRSRGARIVPRCPYVAAYVQRHPGEADLFDGARA
jgi:predicted GNAT family acetyltransferase